jgi:hypothetical protein
MFDSLAGTSSPQFETAQYAGTRGSDSCKTCGLAITGPYYRIGDKIVCPACAQRANDSRPADKHSAYVTALIFGIGAAVLGLILYATVAIVTGLMIGYVALAVGYIIGKGMMMGSKGIGGRRYQITAVLLTYAAVSMAAVPIALSQQAKHHQTLQRGQKSFEQQSGEAQIAPSPVTPKPRMSVGRALGTLAVLGLASPFLELQSPVHGIIGLFILLIGIRIAWQSTAGHPMAEVSGPF